MWTPPNFSDQAPSTQFAVAPQTPSAQPNNNDMMAQYQSMLAPYQQRAQQIFGGNPVFGNSDFAQNHPTAAHVFSNLLLAASKAQPGATPADSIRIAAQMALTPREAGIQQQLNLARAPGELMAPELQLLQHLSQMRYQNSEVGRNQAMSDYYSGAKSDLATAQAGRANEPKTHFGPPVMDPNNPNQMLQPEYDSATGRQLRIVPIPGAPVTKTKPGDPNRDFTQSGILRRLNDPDPAVRAEASTDRDNFINLTSGIAGGKTGAEQGAPHAASDKAAFISDQRALLQKTLPAAPKFDEWSQSDILAGGDIRTQAKRFSQAQDDYAIKVGGTSQNFAAYMKSGDPEAGVPFDVSKNYHAKSQAPAANGNSGSSWQPK